MWRLFGIWCSENHYSRKITNFTETNLSQQVGIRHQGMLGHILGILVTIGLVVLLYNELIKPMIRSWRKKK